MAWTFYNSSGEAMIEDGAAVAATQAEMETATATGDAAFVTPGRTQYHPGVAKGWIARIEANGTLSQADYNVASVTDTGTGDRLVVWDTDFSGTEYAVSGGIDGGGIGSTSGLHVYASAAAAGNSQFQIVNSNDGALVDINHSVWAFGDQ